MKIIGRITWTALIYAALLTKCLAQPSPPTPPPSPVLDFWPFADTNWLTSMGYAPVSYANITNVPVWFDDAVVVDTSNSVPAYLQYNIVEADGHTNLSLNFGSLWFWVNPDWSSTNQGGTGPAAWANFLSVGQWTSNADYGWWSIYTDPAGCNLYFSAQADGLETNYFTTPISWASNSFHFIGLSYSPSNSTLCVDGSLSTNGPGIAVYPGPEVLTNGFFIGSDSNGLAQAQAQLAGLRTWDTPVAPGFLNLFYTIGANQIAAWQGGSSAGPDFSGGILGPGGPVGGSCVTNGQVFITNFMATPVSGQGMTVTFTVMGGTNGPFDAFCASNPANAAQWTWLGEVYTCNTYQLTNQPNAWALYMLALPVSSGSGLPVGWCLTHGLNPQDSSLATEDPKNDGLDNLQKYLYGADPQTSLGFAIWVGNPSGLSGLP